MTGIETQWANALAEWMTALNERSKAERDLDARAMLHQMKLSVTEGRHLTREGAMADLLEVDPHAYDRFSAATRAANAAEVEFRRIEDELVVGKSPADLAALLEAAAEQDDYVPKALLRAAAEVLRRA